MEHPTEPDSCCPWCNTVADRCCLQYNVERNGSSLCLTLQYLIEIDRDVGYRPLLTAMDATYSTDTEQMLPAPIPPHYILDRCYSYVEDHVNAVRALSDRTQQIPPTLVS